MKYLDYLAFPGCLPIPNRMEMMKEFEVIGVNSIG